MPKGQGQKHDLGGRSKYQITSAPTEPISYWEPGGVIQRRVKLDRGETRKQRLISYLTSSSSTLPMTHPLQLSPQSLELKFFVIFV